MDEYLTPANSVSASVEIKKSVFICSLFPAASENEARELINAVKKEHYKATHNCYAYCVLETDIIKRFSDDGEPGGTAGRPILGVLDANALTNVLAVVTRYFGGVKLGAGGLTRAYSKVTAEAVKLAEIKKVSQYIVCDFSADYAVIERINAALAESGIYPKNIVYGEDVAVTLYLRPEDIEKARIIISTASNGQIGLKLNGESIRL